MTYVALIESGEHSDFDYWIVYAGGKKDEAIEALKVAIDSPPHWDKTPILQSWEDGYLKYEETLNYLVKGKAQQTQQ